MTIEHHADAANAAQAILNRVGKNIVIGVPLGIGKPIALLNALYRLVENDTSLSLTILTGLTLARPHTTNALEKRLVLPILDRLLHDYIDPDYELARQQNALPKNIRVIEFFFNPGRYLTLANAQQHYVATTYTLAVRDLLNFGINVHAQLVAKSETNAHQYSLSCNTDLFHALHVALKKVAAAGKPIATVVEVNQQLPFMEGEAIIHDSDLTDILDTKNYATLFPLPRDAISVQDQLIGLYTSTLIQDNGCLQLGIGKLSNALASALIFRQQQSDNYLAQILRLGVQSKFGDTLQAIGGLGSFKQGLYASTEMLSDEYLQLYQAQVIKKAVYDDVILQRLLNADIISERVSIDTLTALRAHQRIRLPLRKSDFDFLQFFGILNAAVRFGRGQLSLPSGEIITVSDLFTDAKMSAPFLGRRLLNGTLIHAGFFIGSQDFYHQLKTMSPDERKKIAMTSIARTNTLTWSLELAQAQRQNARFVNSALMLTLGGAVVSDGIKGLKEVSGVGGQFDFVHMAHHLEGARSIIQCRSVRETREGPTSNIVLEYPNITIPRYLRDVVVTEYGIADCRGKTDSQVAKSLLNVTDSRFQPHLLREAKAAGKLPSDYQIPAAFQQNYPQHLDEFVRQAHLQGACSPYPFGQDLTESETQLANALAYLSQLPKIWLLVGFIRSFFIPSSANINACLNRMKLNEINNLTDFFQQKILKFALHRQTKTKI